MKLRSACAQRVNARFFLRALPAACAMAAAMLVSAQVFAQSPLEASPASEPVPATVTPQTYPEALVEAGRVLFATNCGFCHGRDTAGASGGSDLTRSELVAEDVRGDLIGNLVRSGRPDAGMPPFPNLADGDLNAMVAFIHDQKARAAEAVGGRRSVTAADLETGNARAGRRYFESNCEQCHSADDLAGVGTRFEGLALLRRMLYPSGGRGTSQAAPAVTVTTADGQSFSGSLEYQDEFTISMIDSLGRYRSWPTSRIEFNVDDPLAGHVELLGRYTDETMHDVFRYLQSL